MSIGRNEAYSTPMRDGYGDGGSSTFFSLPFFLPPFLPPAFFGIVRSGRTVLIQLTLCCMAAWPEAEERKKRLQAQSV